MTTFALEKIEAINGKVIFYDLKIDDISQMITYELKINNNKQYKKEYLKILVWMDLVSQLQDVPTGKYKPLKGCKDEHTEYEFSTDHLRVYCFQLKGTGKIVVLWGFKNNQNADIKKFRSVKDRYIQSR